MKLEDLIASLASKRNLPAVAEPDGGFTLGIDGRYDVRCLPMAGGRAVLTTMLSDLPKDPRQRDERLSWLMRLNLAYLKNGTSVLAVDEEAGRISLHHNILLAETTPPDFEAALRDFLNDVDFWIEISATPPARAPSPMMLFP